MAKSKKRGSRRGGSNGKFLQRAMSIDVLVAGGREAFQKAIDVVRSYRMLARNLMAFANHYELFASHFKYVKPPKNVATKAKKKPKKKTKQKAKTRGLILQVNRKMAKLAAMRDAGIDPRDRMKVLYEYRPFWMTEVQMLKDSGGPRLATHIWDSTCPYVAGMRRAPSESHGGASRGWLQVQGIIGNPQLEQFGMPIMHHPRCGRSYVTLKHEDGVYTMRLQYGMKDDYIDVVLHGDVPRENSGESYHARLSNYEKGVLDRIIKGEPGWSFQTPVLRFREGRSSGNKCKGPKFWLNIHYQKPRLGTVGRGYTPGSPKRVCEVVFDKVAGADLPKRKNDTGTDDEKTFVIHASVVNVAGERDKARTDHIPVDGWVGQMIHLQNRKRHHELIRDCRRRAPKRLVRPIVETIRRITILRSRQQKQANRIWAKQIVTFAMGAGCGKIKVYGLPDGTTNGLLLDATIPWQWSQLFRFIEERAEDPKIAVKQVEADASIMKEIMDALKNSANRSGAGSLAAAGGAG